MSGTLGVKIPAESRRGEGGESQVRAFSLILSNGA